jgi:hypothetical protein
MMSPLLIPAPTRTNYLLVNATALLLFAVGIVLSYKADAAPANCHMQLSRVYFHSDRLEKADRGSTS